MARASASAIPWAAPRGWRGASPRGSARARPAPQSSTAPPGADKGGVDEGAWVEDGEITALRLARAGVFVLEGSR